MISPVTFVQYPYPFTLNIGNFVSLKLSLKNYIIWKTYITSLIESQNMKDFLDRSYPKPNQFIIKTSLESKGIVSKKENVMNTKYNS